jgi:hypothetical protein
MNAPLHPLGVRRNTDVRNRRYLVSNVGAPRTVRWARYIPIIDQGDVGSCVGQAFTGALGTYPLWYHIPASLHPVISGDPRAYGEGVYSDATIIDPYPGVWPPDDTGSDTRSGAQVLLNRDLIMRYEWIDEDDPAQAALNMLGALAKQPIVIGIPWFDSFDWPNEDGFVSIAPGAEIRGGHALVVDECNVEGQFIGISNSWGSAWGSQGGRLFMSWSTLQEVLSVWGDACVPVYKHLSPPAPTPVPWWKKIIDFFFGWMR